MIDIRSSGNKGNITYYDLATIIPSTVNLSTIELTGQEIRLSLEHSVRRY